MVSYALDVTAYRHSLRVRYGECDMQGVVFNAHYLAYCDDGVENWLASLGIDVVPDFAYDFMLKKAVLEWQGPAHAGEVLHLDMGITRWGRTSFDVGFDGRVGDRSVFAATITYVGVQPGTTETTPPPAALRALLGEAAPVG